MKGISLIIPVYNEEKSLRDTVDSCMKMFAGADFEKELIMVNDGSTDQTAAVIEEVSKTFNIRVISNQKNRGYGASIKKGIKHAMYDNIFISDCDGTYPIDRLPELAQELLDDTCDMIVGARCGKNVAIPMLRRPAKKFIGMLANYLSGYKIPDVNSGFRGFKKEVAEKFINILPDGFSLTTTITIAMLTNDYTVKYTDIEYFKRKGYSKIHPIKDTSNFIKLIIRTVLYFDPLKIFLPLSAVLFFAGLGTFLYSIMFMQKVLEDTTVILVMAGFQIFAIGLIADLIEKRMKNSK